MALCLLNTTPSRRSTKSQGAEGRPFQTVLRAADSRVLCRGMTFVGRKGIGNELKYEVIPFESKIGFFLANLGGILNNYRSRQKPHSMTTR